MEGEGVIFHLHEVINLNNFTTMETGRPMVFESPEQMQAAISEYFRKCREQNRPMTIEGLSVALEINRRTLLNYEKLPQYKEFFPTVKKAKETVQADMVERGLSGNNNSTLSIFLLKNNYGYEDKYGHEVTPGKILKDISKDQIAEILADE